MGVDPKSVHYRQPGWFTKHVFNRAVAWMTRRGVSVWGSRVLEVPGRTTGRWRSTPVNLLEVDGATYLVAARGVTQWVRNLRSAGEGRLRLGRTSQDFRGTEVPPEDTVDILRAYLRRWKWEVGQFFDGVGPDSTDEELAGVAHRHPVFRLELAG